MNSANKKHKAQIQLNFKTNESSDEYINPYSVLNVSPLAT